MDSKSFYAVIMAGGGGTRLWPLSRRENPKQLLRLIGDQSLFQLAYERLKEIFPPEKIFVVTVKEQAEKLRQEVEQIPFDNYVIEPMPRGTASVVALSALHIQNRDPDGIMAILTADHIIKNIKCFHKTLKQAEKLAHRELLITLGIKPTYPAIGYGYIQRGKQISESGAFSVMKFVEKPDAGTAKNYLKTGEYYWNSGMFIWKAEKILKEIQLFMPELANISNRIKKIINTQEYDVQLPVLWAQVKPQTIDYGIMEKAEDVVVLPAEELGWSDIGSWDSVAEMFESDKDGNIFQAKTVISEHGKNCFIKQDGSNRLVAIAGLKDLVVIDTEDVLLICKRNDTQQVKNIVEALKEKKLTDYL